MKYILKSPIDNIAAWVQIVDWRPTGDKPLSEPIMAEFGDSYMRPSASMS